jgi:hypothetical protein
MIPGLEDRLVGGSEEDVVHIAEMVCLLACQMSMIYIDRFGVTASERCFQCQIR